MDIPKLSKPPATDLSIQTETSDSISESKQTTGEQGFEQNDTIQQIAKDDLTTNLFVKNTEILPDLQIVSAPAEQTVLGKPEADDAPVSQSYAAEGEANNEGKSNSYSAIRQEVADALNVDVSDSAVDTEYARLVVQQREDMETRMLAERQSIIDAALKFGRREEVQLPMGMTEFKEFIPVPDGVPGDAFVRWGTDTVVEGIFSSEISRFTRYLGNGGVIGTVWSTIKDGKETITKVNENIPGAIGLKPGDTRDVPDAKKTSAGLAPSTWDPQPDGRYGNAGGSQDSGSEPGGATDTSFTGGANIHHDPDHQMPLGSTQKSAESSPTTSNTTSGNLVHVYHSDDGGETWEDRGVQSTEEPKTEVIVEEPETDQTLAEEEDVEAGADDSQAAYGDYADLGSPPPQQPGTMFVSRKAVSSDGGGYGPATSKAGFPTEDNSGYADKAGAPIDYGDSADPFANVEIYDSSNAQPSIGYDPDAIDPGRGEGGDEAATIENIRLDMAGSLRDGGNPVDPFAQEAPAADRPNTSEAERPSGPFEE